MKAHLRKINFRFAGKTGRVNIMGVNYSPESENQRPCMTFRPDNGKKELGSR